jgi:hypothetical protein
MKGMTSTRFIVGNTVVALALLLAAVTGCNAERKQECDKFIAAMGPMQSGPPSADVADRVASDVAAIQFQDEPLHEYATNYKGTLAVLSSTLKLKDSAGPDGPPDGTFDVIKTKSKEAHTDFDDISRYCAP